MGWGRGPRVGVRIKCESSRLFKKKQIQSQKPGPRVRDTAPETQGQSEGRVGSASPCQVPEQRIQGRRPRTGVRDTGAGTRGPSGRSKVKKRSDGREKHQLAGGPGRTRGSERGHQAQAGGGAGRGGEQGGNPQTSPKPPRTARWHLDRLRPNRQPGDRPGRARNVFWLFLT